VVGSLDVEVERFELEVCEFLAGHHACGDLGDRQADHLGDKWHRARGARVHFKNVNVAILDGVLHVHEADDVERKRKAARLPFQLGDHLLVERVGRQRARRVTGVNASLLDVLHDAGDERVLAVAQAIDVDLDGVGEIAVEQQRTLCRHDKLRRPV